MDLRPGARPAGYRPTGGLSAFMIADAVRYMSICPWTAVENGTQRDSAAHLAPRAAPPAGPRIPRPSAVSAGSGRLGSNQRRLSRRFYRPLIIKSVCPLRASPYGGSSDTTSGSAAQVNSVPSWTACSNDNHDRGHRAKICTPRSPRGQHGASTALGNDGNQPGTTGKAPGRPSPMTGLETRPHGRGAAPDPGR